MNEEPMFENACIAPTALAGVLNNVLQSERISDYCPNGLQVEGRGEIRRVITGVTASLAFLKAATEKGADAVLVHHGLFWKGDPPTLTGFRRQRLAHVLAHDLNVFAYHLPLDVHPVMGNNIQLGLQMGWTLEKMVGEKGLVCVGEALEPMTVGQWCQQIQNTFGRHVECIGEKDRIIKRFAWCTGGAASYVELASLQGVDAYLTGELSEPAVHVAMETGTVLLGAGHHATERGGVLAIGEYLKLNHGLEVEFLDFPVPV
jgi:dinuclear metal center YbgI/SA1388 family protein